MSDDFIKNPKILSQKKIKITTYYTNCNDCNYKYFYNSNIDDTSLLKCKNCGKLLELLRLFSYIDNINE